MNEKSWKNLDAVIALADLCARTGAREMEVGYLDEGVPSHLARWYAQTRFRGAVIWADEQPSPQLAAELLAHKLLDGGHCTNCGQPTQTGAGGPGTCWWHREGERWVRGCDGKRQATKEGKDL